jgi:hypothetical protein
MLELSTANREMGDEDENDVQDNSGFEKWGVQLASLCW